MMKTILKIATVILVLIGLSTVIKSSFGRFGSEPDVKPVAKNTILELDLKGVILNGKKFLSNLKKYKDEKHIKAVVININSPGGAVGPSQEISYEIQRFKTQKKVPVICVSTGIMASGAYYSAISCDKIVVAPGALVGSIGVIMEFANLEKLYDWAHIQRYAITSGKFKDSGAEFRSMRDEEKQYFQDLITETYKQFRKAVLDGRNSVLPEGKKLTEEMMDKYADGRVFNGTQAVQYGFADVEGYYEDAIQLAAKEANLGEDYNLYEIKKHKKTIWDMSFGGGDEEDDDLNSIDDLAKSFTKAAGFKAEDFYRQILRADYLNQPMYLVPGYWK